MIGFSCPDLSTNTEKTLAGYCRFLLLRSKFFPNIAANLRRHKNEDHHAQFTPARHARESSFFWSSNASLPWLAAIASSIVGAIRPYYRWLVMRTANIPDCGRLRG
jgi:hypothetical protein